MKPVSIRDIARLTDLSVATVSRALSESPHVSAAVRKKVLECAAKAGYQRNALASEVMRDFRRDRVSHHRGTIAYACWNPPAEWEVHEHYARIYEGAAARARTLGFDLEITVLDQPGITLSRAGRILHARGVQGIIFAPLPERREMTEFPWHRFSSVVIGRMLSSPAIHRIHTDHGANMMQCLSHLEKLGCQRIGFASPRRNELRMGEMAGARYALHQSRLPRHRRLPALLWDEWNRSAFLKWFAAHQPDGLILQDPEILRELPKKILKGVRCCAVAPSPHQAWIAGPVPCHELIGAKALEFVSAAMLHRETGIPGNQLTMTVPGVWRDASGSR